MENKINIKENKKTTNNNDHTKIDAIIPIFNPEEKFQVMFKELQKQTIPINKFIICETVGKKEKEEETEIHRVIHFTIDEIDYDHGKTRNIAASKSNAEYILFMTQDAIPYNNKLVEKLLSGFNDEVACVYAKQIPYPDCNEIESYTRSFNYPNNDIIKDASTLNKYQIKNYFCSNVCCMYNKKIFDLLGGFDENIILNEDEYFAYKAINNGYKIVYKSDALVYHSHNYTVEEYYKRNFDIAVSQAMRPDIFGNIKSEKEGIHLVIDSLKHFICSLQILSCLKVIIYSAAKYMGYRKGKAYKSLEKEQILKSTMNKNFWRNY